jgi:hypothetical protein
LFLSFVREFSRAVQRIFGLAYEKDEPVSQFLRIGMRAVR